MIDFKKQLRKGVPKYKTDCFVCDKHKEITEWHHVTPICMQPQLINDGIYFENEVACVCPNCHSYIHKLYKLAPKEYKSFIEKLIANHYSKDSIQKFGKILEKHEV